MACDTAVTLVCESCYGFAYRLLLYVELLGLHWHSMLLLCTLAADWTSRLCRTHAGKDKKPFSQPARPTCCAVLQLREIAPEFYTPLQCHTSWCWVIWKFLSDPAVGPWTRMKRETREGTEGGQEPIALHTKTAFADITNLPTSPAGKAVKAA